MSAQQKNDSVQKLSPAERRTVVVQALASVRAEGLDPSALTQKRMGRYAQGEITLEQLQRQTLEEIQTSTRSVTATS